MKITFGMPEVLILFSLFIYQHSFWFSITSFVVGILGRLMAVCLDWQNQQETKIGVIVRWTFTSTMR